MNNKIKKSIEALRLASNMSLEYYKKPLRLAYSGGKDSDVLLDLALRADIPFVAVNSHTTVDSPYTVWHIRDIFRQLENRGFKTVIKNLPKKGGNQITMWNLIIKKGMPPTRFVRYCCQVLKENTANNSMIAMGIRTAESVKRRNRDVFAAWDNRGLYFSTEHAKEVYQEAHEKDETWDCKLISESKKNAKIGVNAIYDWTNGEIWDYCKERKIKLNQTYNCGFYRVGCIGCPLATVHEREKQFSIFPAYKKAYINAFDKMLETKKNKGLKINPKWKNGESVFNWWLGYLYDNTKIDGQIAFNAEGETWTETWS